MYNITSSLSGLLYRHSWLYRHHADNRADAAQFKDIYDNSPFPGNTHSRCVAMFNGKAKLWGFDFHGGLADRLKGMISVYKACKENGTEFKILHTMPFLLEKYLEPNSVDWRISEADITYNTHAVSPHWLRHSPCQDDEEKYFSWRLSKLLKSHRTLHIYTNALTVGKDEFRALFHELFKPSPLLQSALNRCRKDIGGGKYLSVSYRFTHLLGDPIDTYMEELDENGKAVLLSKALSSIKTIHEHHPEHKLLINSDSATFLSMARGSRLNYVYTVPGVPVHIDQQLESKDEYYMKTFVDFLMISEAEKVYLVKIGRMRNSGFPRCAAMAGGKPFEVLSF